MKAVTLFVVVHSPIALCLQLVEPLRERLLVEMTGFEPVASGLQSRRSPN